MKKTWTWGVNYTNAAGNPPAIVKTDVEIAKTLKYAGFSSMEGNYRMIEGRSDDDLAEMRRDYNNNGIVIDTFHLPYSEIDDVACLYETYRLAAVRKMKTLMDKVSILGTRAVILHPSPRRVSVEVEGLDRMLDALTISMEELLPHAAGNNLIIALENMIPRAEGMRLGSLPEHFEHFERRFAHPNLAFCLDTGHANASYVDAESRPLAFMEVMGERLQAFHLQDNAGSRDLHLAPGFGTVDWTPVFRKMAELEYAHAACMEAPPFAYGPNYSFSDDAWRGMVRKAEELVSVALS